MKTLIFCTAFAARPGVWEGRYRWWLRAVRGAGLEGDQILIVDDGSSSLPDWPGVEIVREANAPTPQAVASGSPVLLYHFENNRGQVGRNNFPGWGRSFAFAAAYARAHSFEKVIHLESDAHLLTPRARRRLRDFRDGWMALWCDKYQMPEMGIQVIAGNDSVAQFQAFAARPYSELAGQVHERLLPFTHVDRSLIGDRYGEDSPKTPRHADYAAQVRHRPGPDHYWWIDPAAEETAVNKPTRARTPAAPIFTLPRDGPEFGPGWSGPEDGFRWTDGAVSLLNLPPLPAQAALLDIAVNPHVYQEHPQQRLLLLINDCVVGELEVRGRVRLRFEIPAGALWPDRPNRLRLVLPDACAPSRFTSVGDHRLLGLAVSEMTLSPLG
jgi:hypothetical protein